MSLLSDYVERFNDGVRSGEWEPMLEPRGVGGAVYAWAKDPERPAGELHLEERDGAIVRIRVLYEQFSA